uniref:Uncharacterized protein n=1 Tax=Peronospora matthiolae TaxID=2874970 RepID=A0AAV1UYW4_9STRA
MVSPSANWHYLIAVPGVAQQECVAETVTANPLSRMQSSSSSSLSSAIAIARPCPVAREPLRPLFFNDS